MTIQSSQCGIKIVCDPTHVHFGFRINVIVISGISDSADVFYNIIEDKRTADWGTQKGSEHMMRLCDEMPADVAPLAAARKLLGLPHYLLLRRN